MTLDSSSATETLVVPLSAKTADALPEVAARLADFLEREPEVEGKDIAFTYQTGKTSYAHRQVVVASSRDDLREQCRKLGASRHGGGAGEEERREARERPAGPRVAFLFTGQGSQYAGMGAELDARYPVFRQAIDRCAKALESMLPVPLRSILFDLSNPERIHATEITQPALFSLEYALAHLWISWGFEPGIVIGHSLGEWVAACIAGAYTVEDACALVFHRGASMHERCAVGAMASVAAPVESIRELVERHGVVVSAYNGPDHLVVAGEPRAIEAFRVEVDALSIACKRLPVSHAFHSPAMDPMLASFGERVAQVQPKSLAMPLVSTLDGRKRTAVDAEYWVRQVRSAVDFVSAVRCLLCEAPDLVIEIGPHPGLARLVMVNPAESGARVPVVVSSLRRGESEVRSLMRNLGRIWSSGMSVPWARISSDPRAKRVHVPTYPYQRRQLRTDPITAADPNVQSEAGPQRSPPLSLLSADSSVEAVEALLISVWTETLGLAAATRDSDFSVLGADSLDAVSLLARTKQVTQLPLTLEEQFKRRTIAAIAALLHERLNAGGLSGAVSAQSPPVRPPALADPSGAPATIAVDSGKRDPRPTLAGPGQPTSPAASEEPGERCALSLVVVVGAIDDLGAHIVRELYETTSASIECLTLDASLLRASWRRQLGGAFVDSMDHRIRFVEQPVVNYLTMRIKGGFSSPSSAVIEIASGSDATDDSVVGALLPILLASAGARYHYVVPAHAVAAATLEPASRGTDVAEPEHPDVLMKSSSARDRELGAAQVAGAPVTIYRVGDLAGHSTTGRLSSPLEANQFYRLLRSTVAQGVVGDADAAVEVAPVDYLAAAVVELAQLPPPRGGTYHLFNPVDPAPIYEALRSVGYSLVSLPADRHAEWRATTSSATPALGPDGALSRPRYATAATRRAAESGGVYAPVIDAELVVRLLTFAIDSRFLAPPPHWKLRHPMNTLERPV